MTACEHRTMQYLQQGRWERGSSSAPVATDASERRSPSVQSEVDESVEKIKITIRSSSLEFSLRVRVTTTCGELVAKFLSKAGITTASHKKRPVLCLDGDKLSDDTTVADLEIEDGDMLEISNV